MEKVTVELQFIRSTKNTHLYTDLGSGSAIGSIYIQKDAIKGERPEILKVTVESGGTPAP